MKDVFLLNRISARRWVVASGALLLSLVAACGGSSATPTSTVAPSDSATSSAAAVASPTATGGAESSSDVVYAFPTGPAVTVPEGYVPPGDHVPATGAYLPANGKPTLVFVDAIW